MPSKQTVVFTGLTAIGAAAVYLLYTKRRKRPTAPVTPEIVEVQSTRVSSMAKLGEVQPRVVGEVQPTVIGEVQSTRVSPIAEKPVSPLRTNVVPDAPLTPRSPTSPLFAEILSLLNKLSTTPDAAEIAHLQTLLSTLSGPELDELKQHSDYLSFSVSEWVFYHTLRTHKEVSWNSTTGLMDEALSPQEREIGTRIASTMRRAFWDQHYEDLEKIPPAYSHVIDRLVELQARINEYRRRGSAVWDLDLVRQVVQNEKFDRPFFISLLRRGVEVMYDIESPAAHEDTVRWLEQHVFTQTVKSKSDFHKGIVSSLEFLFAQLDVLEAEMANFKTAQMGIEAKRKQERDVFRSLVTSGVIEATRIKKMLTMDPDELGNVAAVTGGIVKRVKQAVIEGVVSGHIGAMPESFGPDATELRLLRKRLHALSALAAVIVGIHSQLTSVFGPNGTRFLQDADRVRGLIKEVSSLIHDGKEKEVVDEILALYIGFSHEALSDKSIDQLHKGMQQCCAPGSQV